MIDINKIIPKIETALTDYFPKNEDQTLIKLEAIQKFERPFSAVVIVRTITSKQTKRLVMKTTAHHPMNKALTEHQNQAVVEYNILKQLYPKFQEVEKCSVPKPILVIPELETYLMEFVDGNILSNELRYDRYFASKKEFSKLMEHFFCCGMWLKKFQEFTGIHSAGIEALDTAIARCEHRLKQIDELDCLRCPKKFRSKVTRSLHNQMALLIDSDIMVSGRHGDFNTYNILCSPHEINVIDFLGYEEDLISIDLISMLVHLENEKLCLTSNAWRVDALIEKFLDGFGEVPLIPRPVLVISETLHRVLSLWGSLSSLNSRFHHKIEAYRRINEHMKWLNNIEEQCLLWPSLKN